MIHHVNWEDIDDFAFILQYIPVGHAVHPWPYRTDATEMCVEITPGYEMVFQRNRYWDGDDYLDVWERIR